MFDFRFDIGDVSDLLGIRRVGNGRGSSFGVECPFCGDKRGKMNFCISRDGEVKNTYHCYNCRKWRKYAWALRGTVWYPGR